MEKQRILVIEDNPDTRNFIEGLLLNEFIIETAENGILGLEQARRSKPDLILLNMILPILSGYEVCNLLKQDKRTKKIPIILLSAKGSHERVELGMPNGANEYLEKPFEFNELMNKIKSQLTCQKPDQDKILTWGSIELNLTRNEVTQNGKNIPLTPTEFEILRLLASKPGTTHSRETLLEEVRDHNIRNAGKRTIDVHIRSLRKKIPPLTRHILSIYGGGYKFEP